MLLLKRNFAVILIGISISLTAVSPAGAALSNLSLSAGYRVDSLDWNIAADFSGSTPNILSELSWDDVRSFVVAADAEIVRPMRADSEAVYFGRIAYGTIFSGDNRDSDYSGDNRTLEWSRSNNDAGDGHVFDLEGGLGFRFPMKDRRWSLMPHLGWAYYEQSLVMQDGLQTVSDPGNAPVGFVPPPVGPFPGLKSSYLAWWTGLWVGLNAGYQPSDTLSWDFGVRWNVQDYRAEADWNLRTDLQHPVSFEHEAEGDGVSFNLGLDYHIREQWDVGFEFDYIRMKTEPGLDIIYLSSSAVAGTRLNEVNWESWQLLFDLKYLF